MESSLAIKRLSALAQDARLAVFRLLVKAGPAGRAAGEIARTLAITPNTLSAQLTVLANAGMVTSRRDGRSIIYAADYDTMGELLVYLMEDCCQGASGSLRAPGRQRSAPGLLRHPPWSPVMKRFHVHVAVEDLAKSTAFYARLFGAQPTVVRDDYAKWMLDDPRVNFAISARGRNAGVHHLGIQVESGAELAELAGRLKTAGETTCDQKAVTCCYATGDKSWVTDPTGVRWETFRTFGEAVTYGEDAPSPPTAATTSCCGARAA